MGWTVTPKFAECKIFLRLPFWVPLPGGVIGYLKPTTVYLKTTPHPPQDVEVCLSNTDTAEGLYFRVCIYVGDLKIGDVVSKTQYTYLAWNHFLDLGGGVSTFVLYENHVRIGLSRAN